MRTIFTVFASALALAASQVHAIELDAELPITTAQGKAMLAFLDEEGGLMDLCENGVKPREITEHFFQKTGEKDEAGYAKEESVAKKKLVPGLEEATLKAWGIQMRKNKQVVNRVKAPEKIDLKKWAETIEAARPDFEKELKSGTPSNMSDAVKNFKAPVSKMA